MRYGIFLSFLLIFGVLPSTAPALSTGDDQFKEASDLFAAGDIKTSISKLLSVIKTYELEKNQKGIADASYALGRSYRRVSSFPQAIRWVKRALQIHQQLEDESGMAWDLTELGIIYDRQGSYKNSLMYSNRALPIHQKTGDKKGLARTLENIGTIYHFKAEYDKALDSFGRAESIAKEVSDKDLLGGVFIDTGGTYWIKGDFPRALEYYDQAEKLAKEPENLRLLSEAVGNRALIHWNQGDLALALEEFNRCEDLFQRAQNVQGLAINAFNIGLLQSNLGNYGESQDALLKAYSMAQQLGDRGLSAVALEGLGEVERELNHLDSALDYFQRSLVMAQGTGEKRAQTYALMGVGSIYERRKQYAAAQTAYRKSLGLFEQQKEKKAISWCLQELARVYIDTGFPDKAIAELKTAMSIQESIGFKRGIAVSNMLLGSAKHKKGSLDQADAFLTTSVNLLREMGESDLLWQALHRKATISRDSGKDDEAVQSMTEAIDIIEKSRGSVHLAEERSGFLEDKLDVYEDLIDLLARTKQFAAAFEYVEKSKARAFLDMLSEARIDPEAGLSPDLLRKKQRLVADLASTNQKMTSEMEKIDGVKNDSLQQEQNRLEEEYITLLLGIQKQNPSYARLRYPVPLKLADVQRMLRPDTAFVEYFVGNRSSMGFVIDGTTSLVLHASGQKELVRLTREFLETIQQPEPVWQASKQSYTRFTKLAHQLYSDLLQQAAPILQGKKTIIIAPDGVLNDLPFEALLQAPQHERQIDFSRLSYLALNFDIQYVPSASVLSALQEIQWEFAGDQRKKFLAFADPMAGSQPEPGIPSSEKLVRQRSSLLQDLPNARKEAESIAGLFPKEETNVLLGPDASESNAKKIDLSNYRILHFATHGLIDEEHPQFSALVLHASKGDVEDGFLTMREIFDLKLRANLVVLSACKTGLGREVRGEGLVGLSRAFFYAGAASVVVSLWNVNDQSTAEFMIDFYRNLLEGNNNATALHEARIKMIHSGTFSHPYYWAPFISIGGY